MERTEYKIGKLSFYQRELTWGEDKQIAEMLTKARTALEDEEIRLDNLFGMLRGTPLLNRLYAIVLHPVWDVYYIRYMIGQVLRFPLRWRIDAVPGDRIPFSQMEQIRTDFFLYNEKLISKLTTLLSGLGLIAEAMNTKTRNSQSSASSSDSKTMKTAKPSKGT